MVAGAILTKHAGKSNAELAPVIALHLAVLPCLQVSRAMQSNPQSGPRCITLPLMKL